MIQGLFHWGSWFETIGSGHYQEMACSTHVSHRLIQNPISTFYVYNSYFPDIDFHALIPIQLGGSRFLLDIYVCIYIIFWEWFFVLQVILFWWMVRAWNNIKCSFPTPNDLMISNHSNACLIQMHFGISANHREQLDFQPNRYHFMRLNSLKSSWLKNKTGNIINLFKYILFFSFRQVLTTKGNKTYTWLTWKAANLLQGEY